MISDVIFNNPNIDNMWVALKTSDIEITYGMLKEYIQNFAGYILNKGCGAGKKVLLWLNNSPEFIVSYFAINLLGATAILVDTKFRHEILDIIKENHVEFIITDSLQEKLFDFNKSLITIIVNNEYLKYEQAKGFEHYLQHMILDEKQISTILYTSGSTGKPKGVMNSHTNLKEALINYSSTLNFSNQDRFIGVVPFFHSYAFDSCMLSALNCGATIFLMSNFVPARVLRIIQEEKITVFHGVPYMYKLICGQLKSASYDCSSLRLCVCAGSRLEEKCFRDFYDLTNKVIHQEYGSTETGTIAVNLCNEIEKAIKYVGKPLKNVGLKLVTADGLEESTLMVISKGMAIGYIGEEPFDPKGYLTQDLCELEDGYLWIKGRADRLINITGLKVNPIEVENCLRQHPDILDVYVKGNASEKFGEEVEAIIVRKKDSLTISEVITHCRKYLAAYKVPSIITWVKGIEKSGLGKSKVM